MTVTLTEAQTNQIETYYTYLHAHGEISMHEAQTTQFVKMELERLGYRTQTFSDCPGVVAEIGSGKPVVAVRADMDALWQEVGGKLQANHSCGHDAHMSMVLVVAAILATAKRPAGTVRLLFQPAEETGSGALAFCDRGVAADIDYLYGVHLRPIQETEDGNARPAILHGACRTIKGAVDGEQSHASRPHLGINAIEVTASLIETLGHVHLDPMIPSSIKMTKLHAGTADNIVPGKATFTLDARAQSNAAMETLTASVRRIAESVAAAYHAAIALDINEGSPAAAPAEEAVAYMNAAITAVLGAAHCQHPIHSSGGDDFNHYAVRYPAIKSTMLALGCDLKPGLHHPLMSFNHAAMSSGARILAEAVLRTLAGAAVH
ncbi:MAG: amidohydrolase [Sporolactobacillus sp.]